MTIKELAPKYENVKSYYGKAYTRQDVIAGQRVIALFSYDTKVATYYTIDATHDKIDLLDKWNYSSTTLRHVKEFIAQMTLGGLPKLSAADLRKSPTLVYYDTDYQRDIIVDIKAV